MLINGECLEEMAKMPDNSIDMVMCDPPYGTTNCKWDSVIPTTSMWGQLERIVKRSGAIVMTASQPFTSILTCSNLDLFKYSLCWEKVAATGHLNAKRMPMRAHEDILVFYKKPPTYNPQKTFGHERKVSSASSRAKSMSRAIGKDKAYGNESPGKAESYDSTERYPRSVVKFSTDKQKCALHPTQKPVALMEYLIKTYSNEGDTILDFTMGSGTTGVACKNLSRDFVGIERDIVYFNIAKKRMQT